MLYFYKMNSIPVRMDIFAFLMFLGLVQGLFLSSFFLNKAHRKISSNIYEGFLLISFSLVLGDIFLSYTGYMTNVIFLNDFSEPFCFAIGPLFYLYIITRSENQNPKYWYLHFIPALLYAVYSLNFMLQPNNYKFNSFLSSYHPELADHHFETHWNPDPLNIHHFVNELLGLSVFIYNILGIIQVYKIKKQMTENPNLYDQTVVSRLIRLSIINSTIILLFIFIKLTFKADLGDYLIASAMTVALYIISFDIIRKSIIFNPPNNQKKYSRSSLTDSLRQESIEKINDLISKEKLFLNPSFSLTDLAKRTGLSTHHLSQILNESFNQSFFEWISVYRIEEAKRFLHDAEKSKYKIEEIAERVGYNSKSAFNTAFKKLTGLTPSQFRDGKE
jgi:AraC-like DNA-binding protein